MPSEIPSIAVVLPAGAPADAAAEIAAAYARPSLALAKPRAYCSDWTTSLPGAAAPAGWRCPPQRRPSPPYLASLAVTHSRAALERRLAAIGAAHCLK